MHDRDSIVTPSLSPSSSPPSPPAFEIDSSPPSSPPPAPLATPPSTPEVIHPFAGSSKATRRPHIYEKRTRAAEWASHSRDDHDGFESHDSDGEASGSRCTSQVMDPLAASAKQLRKSMRGKKRMSRVDFSGSVFSASMSCDSEDPFSAGQPSMHASDTEVATDDKLNDKPCPPTPHRREQEVWNRAISDAIDKSNGDIDLSQDGYLRTPLTVIPPSIGDLANLVILPDNNKYDVERKAPSSPHGTHVFARSATVPASEFDHVPFFSASAGRATAGLDRAASYSFQQEPTKRRPGELQLKLVNQAIKVLPTELFTLTGLTVLHMRSNALTAIPPQISKLVNLRELNISQNRLQWLPAEMLGMRLEKLSVKGNPWRAPTRAEQEQADKRGKRPISQITSRFEIPSLSEFSLRALFAPAEGQGGKTNLEALFALPLPWYPGLQHAFDTLSACVPGSVATADSNSNANSSAKKQRGPDGDDVHTGGRVLRADIGANVQRNEPDADTPPGIGICPCPVHRVQGDAAVFVQHAEERFTWELIVAGQDISKEELLGNKVGVPVLWRSCLRGCLDFLDDAQEVVVEDMMDVDLDSDEGEQKGVELVRFGGPGSYLGDPELFE